MKGTTISERVIQVVDCGACQKIKYDMFMKLPYKLVTLTACKQKNVK